MLSPGCYKGMELYSRLALLSCRLAACSCPGTADEDHRGSTPSRELLRTPVPLRVFARAVNLEVLPVYSHFLVFEKEKNVSSP